MFQKVMIFFHSQSEFIQVRDWFTIGKRHSLNDNFCFLKATSSDEPTVTLRYKSSNVNKVRISCLFPKQRNYVWSQAFLVEKGYL